MLTLCFCLEHDNRWCSYRGVFNENSVYCLSCYAALWKQTELPRSPLAFIFALLKHDCANLEVMDWKALSETQLTSTCASSFWNQIFWLEVQNNIAVHWEMLLAMFAGGDRRRKRKALHIVRFRMREMYVNSEYNVISNLHVCSVVIYMYSMYTCM